MSGDFSFLKGNIYTIILCSLYGSDGHGDKYGYEIAKEIKERTENKYEIKQPTLYAYLKKLEQQGSIESYWGTESNGGRRRYYKLTEKGRGDCERFIAEWEYHKNVLSTLVDKPDATFEISQSDVTPLFGEKQKRAKKVASTKELEEQDEIARRLDALFGSNDESIFDEQSVKDGISQQEEQEEIANQTVTENFVEDSVDSTVDNQSQFEILDESSYKVEPYVEPVIEETVVATPATNSNQHQSSEDVRAKFDVRQDNADDFMQQFDERARVISESRELPTESSENYQHVLMNVIGDQLNDMRDYSSEQQDGAQKYYTDHPVALEDVADSLAKQGIRLRIYNHASSNFKSKTLMPNASVLCKTAWLTFAVAAVYFCILMFTSIAQNNWQPFLITLAVLTLVPLGFTAYALYDPSRIEKPRFKFNRFLVATIIIAAIVVLLAVSISVINNIELSNYAEVSTHILIPTGIAILIPIFVVIYNQFYKKY